MQLSCQANVLFVVAKLVLTVVVEEEAKLFEHILHVNRQGWGFWPVNSEQYFDQFIQLSFKSTHGLLVVVGKVVGMVETGLVEHNLHVNRQGWGS